MPAGWRPRGFPEKEMIEITTENQIRFRSADVCQREDLFDFASDFRNRADDRRNLESLRLDNQRKMDRRVSSLVANHQLERNFRSQIVDLDFGKSARYRNHFCRDNFQRNLSTVAILFGLSFAACFYFLDDSRISVRTVR